MVHLSDSLSQNAAIDVLVHEWANARAWNYSLDKLMRDPEVPREDFETANHDAAWGYAYSRVWQVFICNVLAT